MTARFQPLIVAVCDPDLNSLALTRAMVQRALDSMYVRRLVSIRGYPSPKALLAAPPCDVCVLSADLEDMDVFDLLEAVRRRRKGAEAVLISRAPTNDIALRAMRVHVSQYLAKPIESNQDFERLKTALRESCDLLLMERAAARERLATL